MHTGYDWDYFINNYIHEHHVYLTSRIKIAVHIFSQVQMNKLLAVVQQMVLFVPLEYK